MAKSERPYPFIKVSSGPGPFEMIFRNAPRLVAFWILMILSSPGFSQKESSAELTDFTGKNYKLQYPASWTLDTSKSFGPAIFFFSPLENPEDKFRENINVLVQDLHGEDINLSRYKEITDKQVKDTAFLQFSFARGAISNNRADKTGDSFHQYCPTRGFGCI